MTRAEKIAVLTANIRKAEDRAQRAIESGDEVAHRLNLDFAEECRAELRAVQAQS